LNEILVNETTRESKTYLAQTDEKKYANVAEFQDFKRGVWDIMHKNKPMPENWFTSTEADDDIVIDHEIQSLNCPITLQLLEKPVKNVNCPHVYSLDAIKELVRQAGGTCRCPVSGCQKQVTMKGVREDKMMARKVREEKVRQEERADEEMTDFHEITEGEMSMMEDMKSES
jgi:E3 SUMO-protein ligase NSE2